MTLNSVLVPPPVSPAGRIACYPTTYFPAAMTAGAATPITLDAGAERTDSRSRCGRFRGTVSGRLVTPDGSAPPPTTIRLVGDAMTDVITIWSGQRGRTIGFETVTGMSDASGQFALLGVPSGDYLIAHADGFLRWRLNRDTSLLDFAADHRGRRRHPGSRRHLRPGLRLAGRMEFPGKVPGLAGIPVLVSKHHSATLGDSRRK